MGGSQFDNLNKITKKIGSGARTETFGFFASYISSRENFQADAESRRLEPETEYELSRTAFKEIIRILGSPDIDLFASRSNHKCNCYVSWRKHPWSESVDAFTLPWKDFYFYALPPISTILRTLRKIKKEEAEGIVVVPDWPV